MDQVVITGIGMLNSLGESPDEVWNNVLLKKSKPRDLVCYNINDVPAVRDYAFGYEYDLTEKVYETCKNPYIDPKQLYKYPVSALYATFTAMTDSGLDTTTNKNGGVFMSSILGSSMERVYRTKYLLSDPEQKYSRKVLLTSELGYPGGMIAGYYGLTGPNTNIHSACASTIQSIDYAMKLMLYDELDFAIITSSEMNTEPYMLHMFHASGALSKKKFCRPLDRNRDGIIVGDGAISLILEKRSAAEKRNANIYGVIDGVGFSTDDYHITSPSETGAGISRSLDMLFRKTKCKAESIDYINSHATGTSIGDEREYNILNKYFPGKLTNAYKANIGHLTSASGGTELALCLLSMRDNMISGCANVDDPLTGDLIVNTESQKLEINRFIKCAFGFGGKCTTIQVSKIK